MLAALMAITLFQICCHSPFSEVAVILFFEFLQVGSPIRFTSLPYRASPKLIPSISPQTRNALKARFSPPLFRRFGPS